MSKTYKIAVLAGDGIGPEVCAEAVKVLQTVGELFGHEFAFPSALAGGAAYEQHKTHLPQATIDTVAASDAVLFGSIGGPTDAQEDPKVRSCWDCALFVSVLLLILCSDGYLKQWKDAEKNCLLGLRKNFNLAVNIRPGKHSLQWHLLFRRCRDANSTVTM